MKFDDFRSPKLSRQTTLQQTFSFKQAGFKYYRPSTKEPSMIGKDTFDLRFPQIKNSLVGKGFFTIASSFICYQLTNELQSRQPSTQQQFELLEKQLPLVQPNFKATFDTIKYTWIGHSSAVISLSNKVNLMIDPIFADRCSPVSCVGPKRFRNPACTIQELPPIDLVFVSHDHYDHLDKNALQRINQLHQPYFVAGIGSKQVFPDNCKMIEMDWTQQKDIVFGDQVFKFIFVPVCHWSKRGLGDQNTRLWGGIIIETPSKKRIFYSGDTGYCGIFKEIGELFGPFDLSILPIGAYIPRQLLSGQHIDPDEAVKVHLELRSKKSVGVHWGTFPLGMEHFLRAKKDLQAAKEKYNLPPHQFITVTHGESFTIPYF